MNTKRFLERKLSDFPKVTDIRLENDGFLHFKNERIFLETIESVNHNADLKKLINIQRGNNLDVEIYLEAGNNRYVLHGNGTTALNIHGFLSFYLKIKNSPSIKIKVEATDLYCPTCDSFRRINSKGICRLCRDILL